MTILNKEITACYIIQHAPRYIQTINTIHLDCVSYRKCVFVLHCTAYIMMEFLAKKF